jgi:hypothetical protein
LQKHQYYLFRTAIKAKAVAVVIGIMMIAGKPVNVGERAWLCAMLILRKSAEMRVKSTVDVSTIKLS